MAINFPPTSGEATDGSFTHTESGITWSWDGTTWTSLGVTGSYSLPIASSSILGGIKVGSNLTISGDGTLAAQTGASVNCFSSINVVGQNQIDADSNSDILTLAAGTGITIATNSTSDTVTISSTGSYTDADVDTHLNVSGATSGQILSWNGTDYAWVADQTGGGGGGSSLQSRTTAQGTTASIAVNNTGTTGYLTIACAKTYVLHKIETNITRHG